MNKGLTAEKRHRRIGRGCRHHWIIETPHGATSRGTCKRCGAHRRFPNAAADIVWEPKRRPMGRWAGGRGRRRAAGALPDGSAEDAGET